MDIGCSLFNGIFEHIIYEAYNGEIRIFGHNFSY
jgi:hypothetical protein